MMSKMGPKWDSKFWVLRRDMLNPNHRLSVLHSIYNIFIQYFSIIDEYWNWMSITYALLNTQISRKCKNYCAQKFDYC